MVLQYLVLQDLRHCSLLMACYLLLLLLCSGDDKLYPAVHTVLVQDSRRKSGDGAEMARIIPKLPFNDTGDSSIYTDNYGCQVTVSNNLPHDAFVTTKLSL